jgi:hypothetical protein
MLGYAIAYGSHSPRDIFDISQCFQTKLTKTPKTYTLILKTSEVLLASSLILIVFIHPYFFMRTFRRISPSTRETAMPWIARIVRSHMKYLL